MSHVITQYYNYNPIAILWRIFQWQWSNIGLYICHISITVDYIFIILETD